ncbi:MAG: MBL fold metallo-hydrolase [Candidatus Aminicenantes bacterium]|nr:MBL fold metallo-hydrolase [Candidatus Aminicenantes bacterium]
MKKIKRREFLYSVFGGCAGWGIFLSAEGRLRKGHPFSPHPSLIPNEKKSLPAEDIPDYEKKHQDETSVLIRVLGTAQDGGIPQLGCYCKNCLRARKDPRFARLISSIAILDLKDRKYFLLDATPDIRLQADDALGRLGTEKLGRKNAPHAVVLTHAHIGHYTGLMFFGYEAMSAQELPVYCSSRLQSFLNQNGPWSQLVRLKNISLRTIFPGKEFLLTSRISLTPLLVPHRDEYSDTVGFRISGERKSLLYIPDIQSWEAWNRSIVEEAGKTDISFLDGTFYSQDELPGRNISEIGHPLIQTSLKTLRNVVQEEKKQVFFTHLNHSNPALDPDGEAGKEIREAGFDLASEGMEFFI